jgi:hypothetical protein
VKGTSLRASKLLKPLTALPHLIRLISTAMALEKLTIWKTDYDKAIEDFKVLDLTFLVLIATSVVEKLIWKSSMHCD